MNSEQHWPRAGLFRRLASLVYDYLVAAAIYMVAGAVSFGLFALLFAQGLLPDQGFEHAIDLQQASPFYTRLIYAWNLFWVAFYFVLSWKKGGQTLGMKAWRLKVQNADGTTISTLQGVVRCLTALGGLGSLAILFNWRNKLALQDWLADCETVVLSKEANKLKER
ncbi:RDD family protein [Gallaecimonas sp. GXIMD4217]|uniref:RDD family protein n=1 Tax=Gallaecimonas sp. GXIMD4217 TaxID=3131927 RepID=UPI00311B3DA5